MTDEEWEALIGHDAEQTDELALPLSYQTNLIEDALSSLEALCSALRWTARTERAWKWVFVAADMLVHSALVQFNSGSSAIGALPKEDREKMSEWIQTSRDKGEKRPVKQIRIAELKELLKISTRDNQDRGSPPLFLSERSRQLVLEFHKDVRNNLTHFKPVTWIIVLNGVPKRLAAVLDVSEAALNAQGHEPTSMQQRAEIAHLLELARRRLAVADARIRQQVIDDGAQSS